MEVAFEEEAYIFGEGSEVVEICISVNASLERDIFVSLQSQSNTAEGEYALQNALGACPVRIMHSTATLWVCSKLWSVIIDSELSTVQVCTVQEVKDGFKCAHKQWAGGVLIKMLCKYPSSMC